MFDFEYVLICTSRLNLLANVYDQANTGTGSLLDNPADHRAGFYTNP